MVMRIFVAIVALVTASACSSRRVPSFQNSEARVQRAVVRLNCKDDRTRWVSGTIVRHRERLVVVTVAHMVARCPKAIEIDHVPTVATLIDPVRDLAVVAVPPGSTSRYTHLDVADLSGRPDPGAKLIVCGWGVSFTEPIEPEGFFLCRDGAVLHGTTRGGEALQLLATMLPGESGGPILHLGSLVGIVSRDEKIRLPDGRTAVQQAGVVVGVGRSAIVRALNEATSSRRGMR